MATPWDMLRLAASILIAAYVPLAPLRGAQCPARLLRAPPIAMLAANKGNVSSGETTPVGGAAAARNGDAADAVDDGAVDGSKNKLRNRLAVGAGLTVAAAGGGGVLAARRKRTLPVVVVHGVLSTALWMEEVADWVHASLGESAYVRCIEIGNGEVDSITRPMEWQLAKLAEQIQGDERLHQGFNMIGHSQGTLLSRAFVQRYDWPQVDTLISWVGPQAGQFGCPTYEPLLGYLNRVTSGMWYTSLPPQPEPVPLWHTANPNPNPDPGTRRRCSRRRPRRARCRSPTTGATRPASSSTGHPPLDLALALTPNRP